MPFEHADYVLLETLVREAPVAFAFYDTELRYRRVNQTLADINALPIEAHIGHRPTEVLAAPIGAAVEEVLRRVLRSGEVIIDHDFSAAGPDGTRYWQSFWYPARAADGTLLGVAVVVADITARRAAEDALRRSQERTSRLQQATALLATALRVSEVVEIIAQIGHNTVGSDWAGVAILDKSQSETALHFVVEGEATGAAGVWPTVPLSVRMPTTEAVRGRRPVYLESRAQLLAWMPYEHIRSFLADSAEHAWAVIPLLASGAPLGVLRFAFNRPRRLDRDERTFLEALAGQCSIALERARLFEQEHETAVSLQRSLLPAELPAVPGVELVARYLPAEEHTEVGGDWYDAFSLPGGELALVLGDVMGKGLAAAAGMGRTRFALRALALTQREPAAVLTGLDLLFTATEAPEQLTTLVYAVLNPATGVAVCSDAGHLPLLHLPACGKPVFFDAGPGSTPLGLAEQRAQRTVQLQPGDTVLAFSDGLVESRERDLGVGLDELAAAVQGFNSASLGELVEHVVSELQAGPRLLDDVTVLGVRLTAP